MKSYMDKKGPDPIQKKIRENIESDGDSRITDFHLGSVGPNIYSAISSVVASHPLDPEKYKRLISSDLGLAHITIEVCKCKDAESRK